jgi:hypothetical protein
VNRAALAFALLLALPGFAEEAAIDPASGLKMTGDWELVRNNCSACHSTRLITSQSGDEEQWLKLIRWMQATQNLWEFDPDTEARIIGYLAENYPPQVRQRRAPIPAEQRPPRRHQGGATSRHGGCGCKHSPGADRGCGCAGESADNN